MINKVILLYKLNNKKIYIITNSDLAPFFYRNTITNKFTMFCKKQQMECLINYEKICLLSSIYIVIFIAFTGCAQKSVTENNFTKFLNCSELKLHSLYKYYNLCDLKNTELLNQFYLQK